MEQTTQPNSTECTIPKKFKIKNKNDISENPQITNTDSFNKWSDKSKDTQFKTTKKCVGNGEEKLAKELDITTPVGGQNSTVDLTHYRFGDISVKDMTKDDCTLGTEGCQTMRRIFRIVNLFVCWIEKYKSKCKLAKKYYNYINKKYGSSRITIMAGIDRYELSKSNLAELNKLLNHLKLYKLSVKDMTKDNSLNSEYVNDIISSLGDKSLQELLNDCVRKEATDMTLIIVDKNKGWCIVKDISKLSCPRITRGAPRINYS